MGLDWKRTEFPRELPDPRGRLRVTVDTGVSAPQAPADTSTHP